MKKKSYTIPFDAFGEMLSYDGSCGCNAKSYDETTQIANGVSEMGATLKSVDFSSVEHNVRKWDGETFINYQPFRKEPYNFKAKFTYAGYSRGRSSALILVKDEQGHEFPIFMSDWDDVVKRCKIDKGQFEEMEWTFIKKGANYGIQLV